jgi:3'-5' exoribonuclease
MATWVAARIRMKNQFVSKLQDGDYVNDYFVASRKDLRPKQSGGKFLGMVFQDRTGDIGGVMWNNAADIARLFEVGDVVHVRGRVSTYQNRLQIQVEQVLPLREADYSLEDLVMTSGNANNDWAQFKALLECIEDPWLKKLNELFFEDADFVAQFTQAAAGKKWHHEYRGGLVRHCYEMARVCHDHV